MTDLEIKELVKAEVKSPSEGVVKQYLDIHEVVCVEGEPVIDRIARDSKEGIVHAYARVKDERFHYVFCIDEQDRSICGLYSEPYTRVYFRATSEDVSSEELRVLTSLKPTEAWNKGDIIRPGSKTDLRYTFSSMVVSLAGEPDSFENKLSKLLSLLESDISGVKRLVEKFEAHITAVVDFHNANSMLGGFSIDPKDIERLNLLGLRLDFDFYVSGNLFLEESEE